MHTIDDEPAYPKYRVSIKFAVDRVPGCEWPAPDLPPDRMWDSTGWTNMYREEQDIEALRLDVLNNWWPDYVAKRTAPGEKYPLRNPGEPVVTVTFEGYETWCLTWFSHWTFDRGQSDNEALRSFGYYVDRQVRAGQCVMGAEDEWRWRDANDGPAPCRCEHCKKAGVIRIDH